MTTCVLARADLLRVPLVRAGLTVAAAASAAAAAAAAAAGPGAEVEVLAELAVVFVEQEDHAQAFCAEKYLWASQQLSQQLCPLYTPIGPHSSLCVVPAYRQAAHP